MYLKLWMILLQLALVCHSQLQFNKVTSEVHYISPKQVDESGPCEVKQQCRTLTQFADDVTMNHSDIPVW